jgi:hypothetical protein
MTFETKVPNYFNKLIDNQEIAKSIHPSSRPAGLRSS